MAKNQENYNMPKRPLNAYLRYAKYLRETDKTLENYSITERTKIVAKRWNDSSDVEVKNKFKQEFENDKKTYENEKIIWMKTEDYKKYCESLKRKKIKKKTPQTLFENDYMEQAKKENPEADKLTLKKVLNTMWKEADEPTKKKYQIMAKKKNAVDEESD